MQVEFIDKNGLVLCLIPFQLIFWSFADAPSSRKHLPKGFAEMLRE